MQFEDIKEGTKVIRTFGDKVYCGSVVEILSPETIRVLFGECSGLYSADELAEADEKLYNHFESLPKDKRSLVLSFSIVDLECSSWDEVDSEMWEDEVDYNVSQDEEYLGERLIGNDKYYVWKSAKLSAYLAQKI
jgi:hypothetical protein